MKLARFLPSERLPSLLNLVSDRVRVDCATAGSTDTCLRIKMGDDFRHVETCDVDYEGACRAARSSNAQCPSLLFPQCIAMMAPAK
jgi:hypothetical protein